MSDSKPQTIEPGPALTEREALFWASIRETRASLEASAAHLARAVSCRYIAHPEGGKKWAAIEGDGMASTKLTRLITEALEGLPELPTTGAGLIVQHSARAPMFAVTLDGAA